MRKGAEGRRRRRSGVLVASFATVAMIVTACGGGGGGASNNASGNSGGSNASTASGACHSSSTDPYPGVAAAEAPDVTAGQDATLPAGTPGKGKPAIKIGTKDFAESVLLGQLYKVALEKKGYTVQFQPKIGGSEVIDNAFKSNQIDLYPEYLGEIATSIADNTPQETDSAKKTFDAAKKFEEDNRDATIFKQTPFQDVDILLVTSEFCKQHNLKSATDLKNVGDNGSGVTFVAQGPSKTRYSGFKGLQEAYGLTNAKFKGVTAGGQTIQVINNGGANLADGFSTTQVVVQAVKDGKLTVLQDPKRIMGFQHVAPVVKKSVAQQMGPEFEQTLNWVSSKLTLDAINAMNKAVQSNGQPEADVAMKFLENQPDFK